ncbi:sigma-54-dependent Fis family transcriptional regulator [Paenibacillus sp. OV219]|uniref:sigma-54 interaction domain-containing protein n=1 Tax=Paenibacillus sp. OV219 TaxID=1884377 RepID=UPI0008CCBBFC|nr:sigma 54-interacting transcriptional regulator [Paenibacillus sp. OV219]SEM89105.1 PAS domain S-box-containing protein [Paenibacillus sp. OV219]
MFKIEQHYLYTNFISLPTGATIEHVLHALTEKSAAIIELADHADRSILILPEELPIIERCFMNRDMDAVEALRDFPYYATICNSSTDLQSELQLLNDRPLVIRADNSETIIGYVPLNKLLSHSMKEQQRWSAYFSTLAETVTEAVTVVDRSGEVICWNPVAEDIYHLPKADILGRRIGEHFEKETLMVLKILDEGRLIRNTYHRPRSDTHVLINASPVRDAEGTIIGGIAAEQDITQLVKLNEELTSAHTYAHQHRTANTELFSLVKGKGPAIFRVIQWARKVAAADTPVLLIGESGVGKEQLAQIIHNSSPRAEQAFLSANCGTVPMGLLESELFGFQGGAFTGSEAGQAGKLELAKDGTLFLNEIDRLSLELQAKLYHYLSQQTIVRSGGNKPIELRTRVIAASTQDLAAKVEKGTFRADLYYALNVVSIAIPPLRERIEDIPAMIQMYLKQFSLQYQKPLPSLSPEVMLAFSNYSWPGNILELRNVLERCVILCDDDMITLEHLPPVLQAKQPSLVLQQLSDANFAAASAMAENRLRPTVAAEADEQTLIHDALAKTAGNKSAAAKLLGVSRGTLYNKMKEFGLE